MGSYRSLSWMLSMRCWICDIDFFYLRIAARQRGKAGRRRKRTLKAGKVEAGWNNDMHSQAWVSCLVTFSTFLLVVLEWLD